jgi:hypothetical protein
MWVTRSGMLAEMHLHTYGRQFLARRMCHIAHFLRVMALSFE